MRAWRLPSVVEGVAGPIVVRAVANLRAKDGERCLGHWDDADRLLQVDADLTGEALERVFYHELVHSALDDTGCCALLGARVSEALCDGIGTAILRFRKGGAFG
jgi:hypothetical protein